MNIDDITADDAKTLMQVGQWLAMKRMSDALVDIAIMARSNFQNHATAWTLADAITNVSAGLEKNAAAIAAEITAAWPEWKGFVVTVIPDLKGHMDG